MVLRTCHLNGLSKGDSPAFVPEILITRRLLDYQVREKLEPQEADAGSLWRPSSPVIPQSQAMQPHRSSVAAGKQSQARAFLSTLLGGGETPDDPIVIDESNEV